MKNLGPSMSFMERMAEYRERTEGAAFIVIVESDKESAPSKWYAVWADGRIDGFGDHHIIINKIPAMSRAGKLL